MKIPFDKLAKIYTNCYGHMPKMADMTIYGKNPLKNLLLQNQIVDDYWTITGSSNVDLVCNIWDGGLPSLFK